ncbi:MAG: hypothetical protein HY791_23235 [Deltaproteobacteria bacterium]|nr:hypothetical protein [Deltaproteobacteria bacterium]
MIQAEFRVEGKRDELRSADPREFDRFLYSPRPYDPLAVISVELVHHEGRSVPFGKK